jgi:hypothetical protein
MLMTVPKINVGGLTLSRVMCGSNPFFGYSHFSRARDDWQREYFTHERIVQVLERCSDHGINCVMSGVKQEMHDAIQAFKQKTGREMIWVCTPAGKDIDEVERGIAWTAEHGAKICMPHSSYVDSNLVISETRINGMERLCKAIRSHGMIPGISAHRPEALVVGAAAGYDLECYILPLNVIGFLCAAETDWQAHVIRQCPKTVFCIKPFGAGRVMPPSAIGFVFPNIKLADVVVMGFTSVLEVDEDMAIVEQVLSGIPADVPLSQARSKAHLQPR